MTVANKVRYTGRIIRTANKLRRKMPVGTKNGRKGSEDLMKRMRQFIRNKHKKVSIQELREYFIQQLGEKSGTSFNKLLTNLIKNEGAVINNGGGGTISIGVGTNNNNGPTRPTFRQRAITALSRANYGKGLRNLFGGMKPNMKRGGVVPPAAAAEPGVTGNVNNRGGVFNKISNRVASLFGSRNKNVPTKIEEVLKMNGITPQAKVEYIKVLLGTNKQRNLSAKKLHILGLTTMTQNMKNDIIRYLNQKPSNNKSGGGGAPTTTSGGGVPPMAVPKVVTTSINAKDPLRKIAGILASTNGTLTNSSKVETILQILKDNPTIIRKARDIVISSSLGRNSKDELISYISDLLDDERNKANYRRKVIGRNGLFGGGSRRGNYRFNRRRGGYYNNNNNNNNYRFNRRRGGGFNLGVGDGRNVAFRKTIPFKPQGPAASNVLRSSNFNRGGNMGNGNGNGNMGNGLRRNNGNVFGGNMGNGNGLRRNNNGQINFRNTFNILPQQQNQNQNVKKRSRPVRMKLLKETVDNVKKKKLIKQIKKIGKVDGLKVITQKKKNIVKYIVKQIRPSAKKPKKKQVVKANQQLIFKNTLTRSPNVNGIFQRNGTRNTNVRQGNAQNTGGFGRTGYTPVAS